MAILRLPSAKHIGGGSDWNREASGSSFSKAMTGSLYCKHCMFYCPDLDRLQKHMETCAELVKKESSVVMEHVDRSDHPVPASTTKNSDKPFVCSKCGNAYQALQSLQRHRWMCDQSRPLVCPVCDAVFYRADKLRNHVQLAHSMGDSATPMVHLLSGMFSHNMHAADQ